jgi:hypothetical protein
VRYLCLAYAGEAELHGVPDRERLAYDERLRASGRCLASEALQPADTATTVRVRRGTLSVTAGPAAETSEQLTGFYLIEASDLNQAIQLAAGIPPARVGRVEVRPIRPIQDRNP